MSRLPHRARRAAACALLVAAALGAGCTDLTAPEALRRLDLVTDAVLRVPGAGKNVGYRDMFMRSVLRDPRFGTPVTILVDGVPTAYRAAVFERALEAGRESVVLRCLPRRVLFAWQGDVWTEQELLMLVGERFTDRVNADHAAECYFPNGAPLAPHIMFLPRDTAEIPWFGSDGSAAIGAHAPAGDDCHLRVTSAMPTYETPATCALATFEASFDAELRQSDPAHPGFQLVTPAEGHAAPVRRLVLAPTRIAGARFVVRCDSTWLQGGPGGCG